MRTVEEPVVRLSTENPFVPPPSHTQVGIKRNIWELDIATYIPPQWWSQSWGWIAFMPHEPDYQTPPFNPLMTIPHRLRRLPGSGRYEMPPYLADCWSKLESDLAMATYLLQVYYGIAVIRPLYPLGFGYKKSHFRQDTAMRSIQKSKEWFSVWVALFSFLIATAEHKEHEVHNYEHLSKKGWADYLVAKGAEMTWVQSVINSVVFCFEAHVVRSGAFIHLSAQGPLQPSVDWFRTYHVPVWYLWGPEEASKPQYANYSPPTCLLQTSTTTIAKSPSHPQSKNSDGSLSQKGSSNAMEAQAVASNTSTSNTTKISDSTEAQAVASDSSTSNTAETSDSTESPAVASNSAILNTVQTSDVAESLTVASNSATANNAETLNATESLAVRFKQCYFE